MTFLLISAISDHPVFVTTAALLVALLLVITLHFRYQLRAFRRLEVTRKLTSDTTHVGEPVQVLVTVRNPTRMRIGPLLASDRLPPSFVAEEGSEEALLSLEGQSGFSYTYQANPLEMGDHRLEEVRLMLFDRLGLFWTSTSYLLQAKLKVYPKPLLVTRPLGASRRTGYRLLGLKALMKTVGTEFAGLREYYFGDDHRLIAWKAMAKSPTERPMVKEHEEERSIHVIVALRNGPGFGDGVRGGRKLDKAVAASLAVNAVASKEGDRASVVYLGRFGPKMCKGGPLEVAASIYDIEPESDLHYDDWLNYMRTSIRRGAFFLLVEDGLSETQDPLRLMNLRAEGNIIQVLLLDTLSFLPQSQSSEHKEGLAVARRVEESVLARKKKEYESVGIPVEICTSLNLEEKALNTYFQVKKMVRS